MSKRNLRIVGFLVAGFAAVLMVTDTLDIGWGMALGVIGIGLIAMAKRNT